MFNAEAESVEAHGREREGREREREREGERRESKESVQELTGYRSARIGELKEEEVSCNT